MHDPSDLLAVVDLADLRDDAGAVDAEKVRAAVLELGAAKPHLLKPPANFDAGVRTGSMPAPPSFGAAIKDAARNGSR
jgi:hypothetical protein